MAITSVLKIGKCEKEYTMSIIVDPESGPLIGKEIDGSVPECRESSLGYPVGLSVENNGNKTVHGSVFVDIILYCSQRACKKHCNHKS